jgi:hypothetical protein
VFRNSFEALSVVDQNELEDEYGPLEAAGSEGG